MRITLNVNKIIPKKAVNLVNSNSNNPFLAKLGRYRDTNHYELHIVPLFIEDTLDYRSVVREFLPYV